MDLHEVPETSDNAFNHPGRECLGIAMNVCCMPEDDFCPRERWGPETLVFILTHICLINSKAGLLNVTIVHQEDLRALTRLEEDGNTVQNG